MNDSLRDLLSPASSTSWIIFAAVDSLYGFSTCTFNTPERLTQPEITSMPALTSRGILSPVRATVFKLELPSSTLPSNGIFSPGLTITVSPIITSSGLTLATTPFRSTLATSGRMSISSEMESRALSSA